MALYKKVFKQELTPWTPETKMAGISVSVPDRLNGSPRPGDMVAVNALDATDMWLVAEAFFLQNYVLDDG